MEAKGYRDILTMLMDKGVPSLMTQKQASEQLGISDKHLRVLIRKGMVKTVGTMVPIGAVARLMCG